MPLLVCCPGCSASWTVAETAGGTTLRCPECQHEFDLATQPAASDTSVSLADKSSLATRAPREGEDLAGPANLPLSALSAADLPELPGFEILGLLGAGGMGQVFKARHLRLDRLVALKMIRPDLLHEPSAIARFHREAQAAARLAHPHIVTVYDAPEHEGRHWLVMEYVEGADLARLLKREGPLPVPQACTYIQQAALGLEHARGRGLVHRDMKPSNLLVTADCATVKILDLGLARVAEAANGQSAISEITHSGVVLGTPAYLAPEQALDPRSADTRSDIYSLGCTIYHLLTGCVPFPGDSLTAVVLKHQSSPAPPLREKRRDIPAALEDVVLKMMAKSPEDRYQTPGEAAAALAPFSRDVPPAAGANPAQRRTRRTMIVASVAGAAGLLAVWAIMHSGAERSRQRVPDDGKPQAPAAADAAGLLFSTKVAPNGEAIDPGTSFPANITDFYAVFRPDATPPGLVVTAENPNPDAYYAYLRGVENNSLTRFGWRWIREGETVNEYETDVTPGTTVWLQRFDYNGQGIFGGDLKPGAYRIVILLGGNPAMSAEASIDATRPN
jgi:hypothetical protein